MADDKMATVHSMLCDSRLVIRRNDADTGLVIYYGNSERHAVKLLECVAMMVRSGRSNELHNHLGEIEKTLGMCTTDRKTAVDLADVTFTIAED